MRGVTAGKVLQRNARIENGPRTAERGFQAAKIGSLHAIGLRVAAFSFEGVGRCGESRAHEVHGGHGAARCPARVKRFGHRAEIALHAGSERAGEADRLADLGFRELMQLRKRCDGAEQRDGPGRVEAAVVVTDRHRCGDLRSDFDADHIRGDNIPPRAVPADLRRADRRHYHRAGMSGHHREHVVELERRAVGAVDQRRRLGRGASGGTEYRRATEAEIPGGDVAGERVSDLRNAAGQDRRKGVGDDFLGRVERLRRDVLHIGSCDEPGYRGGRVV